MAKRTTNQILEDESIVFFQSILPKQWLFREKSKDYGIDCEVEIFDEEGNSTGLVFWVQLKATASKKISIRFNNDKIKQFNSYNIPVLIFRYSSQFNKGYFLWSGSININPYQKSTEIKFNEINLWDESSSNDILKYLINYNLIKRGDFFTPYKIFVEHTKLNLSVVFTLKQYLSSFDFFNIGTSSHDALIKLYLTENIVFINIGDIAHVSFSLQINDINTDESIKKIILSGISICLYKLGKNEIASEIIIKNDLLQVLISYKFGLETVLYQLFNGNFFIDALKVLDRILENLSINKKIELYQIISIFIINKNKDLKKDEQKIIRKFYENQIKFAYDNGDNKFLGISYYNLASFNRYFDETYLAIFNYFNAKRYNPNYKQQPYFYFELAGCFFINEKYKFSESFYKKAIDLNCDIYLTKALLADSILYTGHYYKSIQYYSEFLHENTHKNIYNSEWRLKIFCLEKLMEKGFPKVQVRNQKEANSCIENKDYYKAVENDFLSDLAWYNIGVKESINKNYELAFIAYCFTALLSTIDVEAWVHATILSIFYNDVEILTDLIRTAYNYNGNEYINRIVLECSRNKIDVEQILNIINDLIIEKNHSPKIIRFFNTDGTYQKLST